MEEYSPWGAPSTDDVPPLPVLASLSNRPETILPSFSSPPSLATSSDDWGQDGGWGAVTEEYSAGFGAPEAVEEREEEQIKQRQLGDEEQDPEVGTRKFSVGDAWGTGSVQDIQASNDGNGFAISENNEVDTSSPSLATRPLADPSSPNILPSPSPPPSPKKESDWGNHGDLDNLPPLPVISNSSTSLSTARDKEWGDANEWSPETIPVALPSFGDAFASGSGKVEEGEEEEGWGGEKAVPQWNLASSSKNEAAEGEERSWDSETLHTTGGKSIVSRFPSNPDSRPADGLPSPRLKKPAAFVNELKDNSRDFSQKTWPVSADEFGKDGFQEGAGTEPPLLTSLRQAPSFSTSTGTTTSDPTELPLSSLFRATPTLYPAFREGIEKTALRSAEVLKGASSAAARSARFGRAALLARNSEGRTKVAGEWDSESPLSTPVLSSERGAAGDEFDLDQPGPSKAAKSSWWGSSSTNASSSRVTTNTPKSLLTAKELDHIAQVQEELARDSESKGKESTGPPAAGASVIGRLFGRLKKPSVVNAVDDEDNSEWNGIDYLDKVGDGNRNGNSRSSGDRSTKVDDPLDSIFNKPIERSNSPLDYAPHGDGSRNFSYDARRPPLKSPSTQAKAKGKSVSLDPFDPFADDDDDLLTRSGTPPIAPVARMASLSLAPTSRSMSPLHSSSPTFSVAATSNSHVVSFKTPLTVPPQPLDSAPQSEFDDFFNSVTQGVARTPTSSSSLPPPLAPTPSAIPTPIPVRASLPLLQPKVIIPPPRPSTGAQPRGSPLLPPPPPSGSPSFSGSLNSFPAPPPPSQPLRGMGLTPPPSSTSLVGQATRPLAPPVLAGPIANRPPAPRQTTSGGGPLSMDDLSFFESL